MEHLKRVDIMWRSYFLNLSELKCWHIDMRNISELTKINLEIESEIELSISKYKIIEKNWNPNTKEMLIPYSIPEGSLQRLVADIFSSGNYIFLKRLDLTWKSYIVKQITKWINFEPHINLCQIWLSWFIDLLQYSFFKL